MKERWAAEVALGVALGLLALVAWRLLWPRPAPEIALPLPAPEPTSEPTFEPRSEPDPLERARALRAEAFGLCARGEPAACLERLDRAKALDAAGDADRRVEEARRGAERALEAPGPGPEAPASTLPSKPAPKAVPKPAPTSKTPSKEFPRKPVFGKAPPPSPGFDKKNAAPSQAPLPPQEELD